MCMTTTTSWTEHDLRGELDRYEAELRAAGKARNTITTYVQHPERFINWLVGSYTPRTVAKAPDRSSSTYAPLRAYLENRPESDVRLLCAEA